MDQGHERPSTTGWSYIMNKIEWDSLQARLRAIMRKQARKLGPKGLSLRYYNIDKNLSGEFSEKCPEGTALIPEMEE